MTEETLGGALLNTIFRTLSNLTMALTHTLKYLIQMHCGTGDIIHLHFSSKERRLRRIKKNKPRLTTVYLMLSFTVLPSLC